MKTAYKNAYRVRKGDTLPLIGKVLEVNWLFIYHLNKVKIGPNPKIIQIDQQLFIPAQIVIDAWNSILQSQWVVSLYPHWQTQSKCLQKLLKYSSQASTQNDLVLFCQSLQLDLSIARMIWKMRIKNGPNPWIQITKIICDLLYSGLDKPYYHDYQ